MCYISSHSADAHFALCALDSDASAFLQSDESASLNILVNLTFLPRDVLLSFYFKVILPSICYGISMWGGASNKEILLSLEKLHYRPSRIIFNLPKDMHSAEVVKFAKWTSLAYNF